MDTTRIEYHNVSVVIGKDEIPHADYPNNTDIVQKINTSITNTSNRLLSDNKRYRVVYPKNSLGRLFTDIENIMMQ